MKVSLLYSNKSGKRKRQVQAQASLMQVLKCPDHSSGKWTREKEDIGPQGREKNYFYDLSSFWYLVKVDYEHNKHIGYGALRKFSSRRVGGPNF